ncbi:hypothetical protein POM88_004537 [Heracleum sosnowskyi]|uniref:Uncharacterized protein n=1 Tax=Heracleum sosnowskyi TaxID=360622 RepID=A0AAD8JI69_9APIA|nr:hypothetical protein POM88_004537 [Heracleum sosnowskyi]
MEDEQCVDTYWDLRGCFIARRSDKRGVQENEVKAMFRRGHDVAQKKRKFEKKSFCAKTMLGKGENEHVIGVDGVDLIRISNLHWRFRGTESITIDDEANTNVLGCS